MSARQTELEEEIVAIKAGLLRLGRMHPGSLSAQKRTRGGEYHQLSYSHLGKGRTRYVRPEDIPSLKREIKNYRRFRELIKRWVQLEIELSTLTREEGRQTKG